MFRMSKELNQYGLKWLVSNAIRVLANFIKYNILDFVQGKYHGGYTTRNLSNFSCTKSFRFKRKIEGYEFFY